ncbi:hypothetical protein EB001_22420 [bacterium]|nr:hypothetical protein [bacterium]
MSYVGDYSNGGTNSDRGLIRIDGTLGGADGYEQTTCKEITLTESLLTPGLQTSATFQSQIYGNRTFKNWDATKQQNMNLQMSDQLASQTQGEFGRQMSVNQTIYRLDNREFQPTNVSNVEEMTFHACDNTLLEDSKTLVSKGWKCTTPDQIVSYVLTSCVGAQNPDVQSCNPTRDYVAELIHPFQVVAQCANMALDGEDPSFIHYMTYGNGSQWIPTHHFRSLKYLSSQSIKKTFEFSTSGTRGKQGYNDPSNLNQAIHFMFPCDYDLLSDLLNGVGAGGQNINALMTMNPFNAQGSFLNGNMQACVKNGNLKISMTNKDTAQKKGGCESDVEKYLLRRQARMGLLEKDKVALRLVVHWTPSLHAGDVIYFRWKDKYNGSELYGSGSYLISSMTHRVQMGGYSTTTLDCVSTTVGQGIV